MPLQNRVTPFGRLEAVRARGAWTGNRGILHNDRREIVAQWRSKAWITCALDFRGRRRKVFSPGHWTELFFLDEATAFAAGHRPCAYCRRPRYREFVGAWARANPDRFDTPRPLATRIDAVLHEERVAPDRGKRTWRARFDALPPGSFILLDGQPCLLWEDRVLPWSHEGYGAPTAAPAGERQVEVLTPASIVAMFRAGFVPQVHGSATRRRPPPASAHR